MKYIKAFLFTFIVSLSISGLSFQTVGASGGCIIGSGGYGSDGGPGNMICTNCTGGPTVDVCIGSATGCHYQGYWECPGE